MDRSSCVRMTPMLVFIALASIAAGCRGDLAPDMPPTVEISVPAEGIAGADVLASLTAADDGILERVVIGWGDATADTIRPAVAAIAMELVHRYGEPGSFTVTATAVDDDGSIVSANGSITINHP